MLWSRAATKGIHDLKKAVSVVYDFYNLWSNNKRFKFLIMIARMILLDVEIELKSYKNIIMERVDRRMLRYL